MEQEPQPQLFDFDVKVRVISYGGYIHEDTLTVRHAVEETARLLAHDNYVSRYALAMYSEASVIACRKLEGNQEVTNV